MTSAFPDGDLDNAVELGAIDDRSVRVWVRLAERTEVTATLETADRPVVSVSIALSDESDWTGVIVLALAEPAPVAPFTVRVAGQTRHGRLAPTPGSPAALTFGFGSCHMPFAEDRFGRVSVRERDAAIYPAIRDDLQRAGGQLFLTTGDHIYADEIAAISVRRDLDGLKGDELPTHNEFLDRYRTVYRGFFNEPGMRSLRETFPTLCVWDDHEIFDNWGSTADKHPVDHLLFANASRAYAEYQHSRNPDGDNQHPPFSWLTRWGDIAILTLDVRSSRDYETGTIIGDKQWKWLTTWLQSADAETVATLFVVSSVPVTHTARWFTRLFDFAPKHFAVPTRDRWASSGFIARRNELLDTLFTWEATTPRRQVFILSGDVHCASAFTIRQRYGPGVIQQITSSAMTTPFDIQQIIFNLVVVYGTNLLERRYRFTRNFRSITHNYGGVRVEPLPDGGHRVIVAIRSWNPRRRRLRTTGRLVVSPAD